LPGSYFFLVVELTLDADDDANKSAVKHYGIGEEERWIDIYVCSGNAAAI